MWTFFWDDLADSREPQKRGWFWVVVLSVVILAIAVGFREMHTP